MKLQKIRVQVKLNISVLLMTKIIFLLHFQAMNKMTLLVIIYG